ncbi:MAG: (Na+)-NQR maturation NqrM [Pseudomonadota bacterium]
MTTVVLAFGIMLIIVAGMAVGVLFGRRPISGSCGGLAGLGLDAECEICGGNPARCESGGAETTASQNPVGRFDPAD